MSAVRSNESSVCVLASGGLDSCVLVGLSAVRYRWVWPLFVRCGLIWEECELTALRAFVARLDNPRIMEPVLLSFPVADLYGAHWSITGRGTPDAATPDDAVYLAGRNLILLAKGAVFCGVRGIDTIAMGPLKSNPFSDASDSFFRSFERAASAALGRPISIQTPLIELHKKDVILKGRDMPLELTFSCISPVAGLHCGRCNKCHERITAWEAAGLADPTTYAV